MAIHSVSYDLHKVRDYKSLWGALEKLGAVRVLESQWLVSANQSAASLRDSLQTQVDNDDSIVVLELDSAKGWATRHAKSDGVAWLKKHIP